MTDRRDELAALAAELRDREGVVDAWLAKSFTDRILVLDTTAETLPDEVRERLADHDLQGADEVYDLTGEGDAVVGSVDGHTRHRFVDTRTRGEHQSYVVE